jgi:hypothetical protein
LGISGIELDVGPDCQLADDPEKVVVVAVRMCYSQFSFSRIWRTMNDTEGHPNAERDEARRVHVQRVRDFARLHGAVRSASDRVVLGYVAAIRRRDEVQVRRADPEFADVMAKFRNAYLDLKKKGVPAWCFGMPVTRSSSQGRRPLLNTYVLPPRAVGDKGRRKQDIL